MPVAMLKSFSQPPSLLEWDRQGHYVSIEVNGRSQKIFVIDTGEVDKPNLVILHGYPTSIYDYWKALPLLSQKYRIIMHDHIGFGLSDKPRDYSYQLIDQATVALKLWKQLGITSTRLLAHDYGTSVATEMIHRHNHNELEIDIQDVTLCNGSMHIELAGLRPIQRLLKNKWTGPLVARLASKSTLTHNFKRIYSDANKVDSAEINVLWQLMLHKQGRAVLSPISDYINQRYANWDRWIGALQATDLPIHILWAEDDPVAVVAMAHLISDETKNSRKTILPNLGHFPMLEDAERWASHV